MYHQSSLLLIIILMIIDYSLQHGKMMKPPARNAAWRFGFKTHIEYNDNELFCGGLNVMWKKNHGKCGICGDSYSLKQPRPWETGGKFMPRIITTKKYKSGSKINVQILITANHKGNFSFSLCERDDPTKLETEDCFQPLLVNGRENFLLKPNVLGNITLTVQLPKDVECKFCILRWNWRGGNNWGKCPDGKGRIGCGPQETFRNCADIRISKGLNDESINKTKTTKTKPKTTSPIDDEDDIDNDLNVDENSPNEIENSIDDQDEIKHRKSHKSIEEIKNKKTNKFAKKYGRIPKRCSCTCTYDDRPSKSWITSHNSPLDTDDI